MLTDVLPFRPALADLPDVTVLPLVADAKKLATLLCMSVRNIRSKDSAGKLPAPVRFGGRVVWRIDEIRAWLDAGCPDRETWTARRAVRK